MSNTPKASTKHLTITSAVQKKMKRLVPAANNLIFSDQKKKPHVTAFHCLMNALRWCPITNGISTLTLTFG